ncbi:hypothetical protein ACB098_02G191900 [Castanea mollissima]
MLKVGRFFGAAMGSIAGSNVLPVKSVGKFGPQSTLKSLFSSSGPHQNFVGSSWQLDCDNETYAGLLPTNFESTPMVGLDAMKHANSTLEDFCRSYFMFHGMDVNRPQSIFKYLPVLSFTGSFLYQLDCLNEKILNLHTSGVSVSERGCKEGHQRLITKITGALQSNPFRPLTGLLECHGLLTERLREEFKSAEEYWPLERKLCSALMNKEEISIEDVMRAIHLKSSDYRILNLLLYQLRAEKSQNSWWRYPMTWFSMQDDVLKNSFNVLRMFVKIYGASRAPTMLVKYITEAEQKYDSLLKTLDPQLALNYQKRRDEVIEEGGKIHGHDLRTWSMPNVIVDEELYRSNFTNPK